MKRGPCFITADCTPDADALLFPGLAALPPHLLLSEAKPSPAETFLPLPKFVAGTLAKSETTAQAQIRKPI